MVKNSKSKNQTKNLNDSDNVSRQTSSGEPIGTGQNYSVGKVSEATDQNHEIKSGKDLKHHKKYK